MITMLTSPEEIDAARTAFHHVFRGADPTVAPFHDRGWPRGLLFPADYQLREAEWHALSVAAAALGEEQAYVSEIEGYDGTNFGAGRPHALLDIDGDSFRLPFPTFTPIVEKAFYSPTGSWGWLTSLYSIAVVSGVPPFMERLSAELDLPGHLLEFAESWRFEPRVYGITIVWVPELLDHLIGPEAAARLLRPS